VLLFQKWQTDSNKLNLLTDPQTRTLGDSLGFGADQTVKLQAALNNLTTASRPPQAALAQVAANAEAIGGDPADAVVKFIGAWEKGPEAVRALRAEIGEINAGLATLPDVAKSLGLSPAAIGLTASVSEADKLKESLTAIRDNQAQVALLQSNIAAAEKATGEGTVARRLAAQDNLQIIRESAEAQIGALQDTIDLDERLARMRAESTAATKAANDLITRFGQEQQELDLLAQLAGDKKVGNAIKLDGLKAGGAAGPTADLACTTSRVRQRGRIQRVAVAGLGDQARRRASQSHQGRRDSRTQGQSQRGRQQGKRTAGQGTSRGQQGSGGPGPASN
jgi:hypothetical protein